MTARGSAGFAKVLVTWIVGAFIVTAMLAAAVPLALGDRAYVVRSGSMSPVIDTGDVVVVEPISPLDARVGEIVTFDNPGADGQLTSHRAITIDPRGDSVRFTTKGDANTGVEHWRVPVDGDVGKVLYRVPKLGFASVWIQSPAGRIGLLIVPALLLAATLLTRIWRHDRRERTADDVA